MTMQADELKSARKSAGLSQAELADAIGMARETVGAMERGAAPIEKRTELAVRFVVQEPVAAQIAAGITGQGFGATATPEALAKAVYPFIRSMLAADLHGTSPTTKARPAPLTPEQREAVGSSEDGHPWGSWRFDRARCHLVPINADGTPMVDFAVDAPRSREETEHACRRLEKQGVGIAGRACFSLAATEWHNCSRNDRYSI